MLKINEVTTVEFRTGTRVEIPPGKVCRILEEDGALIVHIKQGEAEQRLCYALNELHRQILGSEGRWAQKWDGRKDRADATPQGLRVAEVSWRLERAERMPRDVDALPLEEEGRFVWLIREGLASPQLVDEMTEYLARITGDGLWVQQWDKGASSHAR
ncbi:hypothetical protein ACFVUB_11215 [Streptomyces niveus]|uniref:hypothetical protein n=1 Tax=Streptomyces niveus TaxID=193462 RepID=UPI0036D7B2EA